MWRLGSVIVGVLAALSSRPHHPGANSSQFMRDPGPPSLPAPPARQRLRSSERVRRSTPTSAATR